jgi:hypothetical protein
MKHEGALLMAGRSAPRKNFTLITLDLENILIMRSLSRSMGWLGGGRGNIYCSAMERLQVDILMSQSSPNGDCMEAYKFLRPSTRAAVHKLILNVVLSLNFYTLGDLFFLLLLQRQRGEKTLIFTVKEESLNCFLKLF